VLGARGLIAFADRPLGHVYTYVINQGRMGCLAVEHLAVRGHRTVLALMPEGGPLGELGQERLAGAVASAGERDVRLRSAAVTIERDAVESVLAHEIERADRATGIYAFNDELALLALDVLRDRGISVPGEMGLIGCDDSPAAEQARPRLTTMRFDDHDRWRDLARHLHAMISGEGSVPKVVASEPAVVAGQTT
jgi:DNA-binding LacI/PurR family transcriptional regulator